MDLMGISETKMKIVIDNYFKSECNVDTSIRQAFEKGFRIGVQKGITLQPERKNGEWTIDEDCEGKSRTVTCNLCGYEEFNWHNPNFCPNCGAYMRGEQDE